MLRHHRRILALGIGIMIVIVFLVVIGSLHPKPPMQKIDTSRIAISRASTAKAESYAPYSFQEARQSWEKMLELWRNENNRLFFRRNFQTLEVAADRTILFARQSEQQALRARDSLNNVARVELILLLEKINEFKANFNQMPIDESLRKKLVSGELLVLEGQAALSRQDVPKAIEKFKLAEQLIGQSGREVSAMLAEYLKNIPIWRQWARETINRSIEHNEVAIIVDKFDHLLYVYDAGRLVQKYPIELGKNWIGHKRQKGDNATPEGQYVVQKKLQNGQSIYYKALVINYPNETDIQKFNEAKRRGELPQHAQIGGLIEIHGHGGKGINWTQGCVALKNDDLDKFFDHVKIGTSVTIIGSLNGINSKNP